MKAGLDLSSDREALSGKTREQLIAQMLTLQERLADKGKASLVAEPIPPEVPPAGGGRRSAAVRTRLLTFSTRSGFLTWREAAREIFHQAFFP